MSPASRPQKLPLWMQINLSGIAFVLVMFLALGKIFTPDHPPTIFSLPISVFRPIALMIMLASVGLCAAVWLFPARQVILGPFALLHRLRSHPLSIVLPIAILVPAAVLSAFPVLHYMVVGLICLLVAISLYLAGPDAEKSTLERWISVIIMSVGLFGLALKVWMIFAGYTWVDEGLYLNTAANLIRGGGITAEMFQLPPDITIRPPWGYSIAIYALWMRVVGLGLIQGRVLSYIIGGLSLPAIYATAKLWFGKRAGLLSITFAAFSYLFIQSVYLRNDAAAMTAVALLLYVHALAEHHQRWYLHFLLGLLCGLSLETHITLLFTFIMFGGYYAVVWLREVITTRKPGLQAALWPFVIGAMLSLAFYLILHLALFPYPFERYLAVVTGASGGFNPGSKFLLALDRIDNYWGLAPVEVSLVAVSLIFALIRRQRQDVHWLWISLFMLVGFSLVGHTSDIMYSIYMMPVLFVGTGALIFPNDVQPDSQAIWRKQIAFVSVACLLSSYAIGFIWQQNRDRLYFSQQREPIVSYIQAQIPPDAGIIGSSTYALYFPDYHPFLIIYSPDVYLGPNLTDRDPDAYWQDVLLRTWPRVLIADKGDGYLNTYHTYLAARHAEQVLPELYVVPDVPLTKVANTEVCPAGVPQIVAFETLPDSVERNSTLTLNTIFVARGSIDADYKAHLTLADGNGPVASHIEAIVSEWSDSLPSSWDAYTFHDSSLPLAIPQNLPAGEYTIELSIVEASAREGDALVLTSEQVYCTVELGQVNIDGR